MRRSARTGGDCGETQNGEFMASIKTISKNFDHYTSYNEAGCIEKVVDNLERNYPQYDYVVINDGSTDDTRKICARRGYNFMDLPVNTGLSGAIKSGMRYANYYGYDYVLQLDGDGQHDPKVYRGYDYGDGADRFVIL